MLQVIPTEEKLPVQGAVSVDAKPWWMTTQTFRKRDVDSTDDHVILLTADVRIVYVASCTQYMLT